jgi:hypothetical protein
MSSLDVSALTETEQPTGLWAAALLHALARDEAAGRRAPRLTEPKLDTWRRFRGRLGSTDLVALLFEDAAVIHRVPFDPAALGSTVSLEHLPAAAADSWVTAVSELPLAISGVDYVASQAQLLGLPTRMARSDLHVVKSHQRVLELPGTGGQLAHHLVNAQSDLTLHENFAVACGTWQELTLAGVIALEMGAPHTDFIVGVGLEDLRSQEHSLRQRTFDFVIGLHPDKGGMFRFEDQLAIWFPTAKVLLV